MVSKDRIRVFAKAHGITINDGYKEEDVDVFILNRKEVIGLKYEYDTEINGYHMYPEYIKICYPRKTKDGRILKDEFGKPKMQLKRIEIDSYKDEHLKNYWDYCVDSEGIWSVYRVTVGQSRKLVAYNVTKDSPELIEAQIFNKEITAMGYKDIEDQKRNPNYRFNGFQDHDDKGKVIRTSISNKWCVKYDKWPIFIVMKEHAGMSFNEIKNVILNEGGTVDEQGFISANGQVDEIVKY